jgi:hypothetical protein
MSAWSSRRITATLAIGGGIIALVGNVLAPRFNDNDIVVYHKVANSTRFAVAGVIVLVAAMLVTAALVGISRTDRTSDLAYYGRLASVIGGSIAILQAGLELYGYRQQARAFDGANSLNVVSAFWATNALDHASTALFATWTLTLLGVAPVLVGAAQLRSGETGSLGAAGIGGGTVGVGVGLGSLLTSDTSTYDVPFAIGSVIVTIWLLTTGVLLWRRSGDADIDVTDQPTPESTSPLPTRTP